MKKVINTLNQFASKSGAALALAVVVLAANSVCMFILHQPEMPEGAKKLRKF
ncbi:MAG: cyclic lactone autoinducer peptide [Oscillospiraceae bacterium]|jgi:cyclic lactone autoinducer peptide|nr:cyclic lactone autoinducer peptide [Oscillospiraceae bacterium]